MNAVPPDDMPPRSSAVEIARPAAPTASDFSATTGEPLEVVEDFLRSVNLSAISTAYRWSVEQGWHLRWR